MDGLKLYMDKIKFLGTAGARFVVIKQLRKSGGIWITLDDTNLLIDPGPGSLLRCLSSKPKLNPKDLDGIILSHKHIDHSNDINIMIIMIYKNLYLQMKNNESSGYYSWTESSVFSRR